MLECGLFKIIFQSRPFAFVMPMSVEVFSLLVFLFVIVYG